MPCTYTGNSLLNTFESAADEALKNGRACDDSALLNGVVEEFVNISGFLVDVHLISNRDIEDYSDPATDFQTETEYQDPVDIGDPILADPILGEMRKRNFLASSQLRAIPDSLERENFLQKFGLYNQEQITLHFALGVIDRDLPRRIKPGDLIQQPNETENRWYEVTDAVVSDYMLYQGLMWKVTISPATHSQDQTPINTDANFSDQYGSDLLTNTAVEEASNNMGDSGLDFLESID